MVFKGVRGQGAMEYLMTYGWAIIVVLIVGMALWYLGLFNPDATHTTTMTGFTSIKPQLAGIGYSQDASFSGIFLNAGGARATITGVTIVDGKGNTVTCDTSDSACCPDQDAIFSAGGVVSRANQHVTVYMQPAECGMDIDAGDPGDPYDLDIEIRFVTYIRGIQTNHVSAGKVRGAIE